MKARKRKNNKHDFRKINTFLLFSVLSNLRYFMYFFCRSSLNTDLGVLEEKTRKELRRNRRALMGWKKRHATEKKREREKVINMSSLSVQTDFFDHIKLTKNNNNRVMMMIMNWLVQNKIFIDCLNFLK